jgi:4-amino-4-deoxy-L-arabinose transferase-like glycosyltransferase
VCALAVLTRGLIGMLFPAGAIVAFLTLADGWHRWRELRLVSSITLFLSITVPWHILAGLRAPGFYWAYFINEHINRALGTRVPHDYSAVPLWLWWIEHVAWLFPWSFFAPLMVREFPALRKWRHNSEPGYQARLLLLVWAGVVLLFFSIEGGSRMEYYSFGAWPALALLLGLGIADAEHRNDRWLRWISLSLAAIGVLVAILTAHILQVAARDSASDHFIADVHTHDVSFYRYSMAHVLDLTPQALADLRLPLIIVSVSFFVAFVSAWILRESRRPFASTVALAVGMIGFFVAANSAYSTFESSLSSYGLARELNQTLRPGDQVAVYGDIRVAPSIAFYSHVRVLLYNASDSNLELGSRFPDAPKTFFTDRDFSALWKGARRALLIVPADKTQEVLQRLPKDSTWILATGAGKTVYVNQPPPDGSAVAVLYP